MDTDARDDSAAQGVPLLMASAEYDNFHEQEAIEVAQEEQEDENDWIFDYVMNVLKSPTWDVAIMDFIDDNCIVFDSEEENKFIYTEIHIKFRELVESLLLSHLKTVGISPEQFVEACGAARSSRRDVNRHVYDQIVAMDDFLTFKKLMVKRNMELELEAVHALQNEGVPILVPTTAEEEEEQLQRALKASEDQDEWERRRRMVQVAKLDDGGKATSQLDTRLMEMELLYKREEMEQAELEAAIALSLAVEEEKLRLLKLEAKHEDNEVDSCESVDEEPEKQKYYSGGVCEEKGTSRNIEVVHSKVDEPVKHLPPEVTAPKREEVAPGNDDLESASPKAIESSAPEIVQATRVLPPLQPRRGSASLQAQEASKELEGRRRQAEEAFQRNQQLLREQKQKHKELMQNAVTPEDMERRARYLREQRDRIVAKKKAEREQKLQKYQEDTRGRTDSDGDRDDMPSSDEGVPEQEAEESIRRNELRLALARRLKKDLLETEQERMKKLEEDQYSELDQQLLRVERMRKDHQAKEKELSRLVQDQATSLT